MHSPYRYFGLTILIILIDQAIKLSVHQYMDQGFIGQIQVIGDFFKLHYVTNPGMAFGITLDFAYGKLFLTIFRMIAMVGIGWYLVSLAKKNVHQGLLWCIGLILGGAIGNVLDRLLYGAVVDFIDVHYQGWHWPAFNIADSAISIGATLIVINEIRRAITQRS